MMLVTIVILNSFCISNFYFCFSKFDMVTYITGCQRLTLRRTECKDLFKDAAWTSLHDRLRLQKSLCGDWGWGGKTNHQPLVYILTYSSFLVYWQFSTNFVASFYNAYSVDFFFFNLFTCFGFWPLGERDVFCQSQSPARQRITRHI